MEFNEILRKKNNNIELSKVEINFAIQQITLGNLPDYKISSLLTSIYINGMSDDELYNLTISMRDSGKVIKLNQKELIIDKHSTGGVGDKITLIMSPIIAALGMKVAKMSGRGLGITGGTIDKLNSVGIKTLLTLEESMEMLNKYNMFIIEQTPGIVPADGILYKLRDVTSTVDSIPLITSSIMSKKLAIESDHIYLDVKVGHGAFFTNMDDARIFAKKCTMIAKKENRKITCSLTDMNQPLGMTVGNRLEVYEAFNFLNGKFYSQKLKDLIFSFVGEVLVDSKKTKNMNDSYKMIEDLIDSKKPLELFLDYSKYLGYENNSLEDMIKAKNIVNILANYDGFLIFPDAFLVGTLALDMKAGRKSKEDEIDSYAGIMFTLDEGDKVKKNDIVAKLYSSYEIKKDWIDRMNSFIKISEVEQERTKIILEVINE